PCSLAVHRVRHVPRQRMLPHCAASNGFYERVGRGTTLVIVMFRASSGILAAIAVTSCHSDKPQSDTKGIAAIASTSLAVRATAPASAPAPSPSEPAKAVASRPKDAADLILSAEKRARVEALAPEAKGFVTSEELERKLYALDLKRGKDSDA